MASRQKKQQDARAARERKQKIFVAVAGVLFLGLAAFQGPKLWKQLNPEPVAGAPTTGLAGGTTDTATGGTTATAATRVPRKAPKNATAQLAGVIIVREQPPEPGDGQLDSFSRFSVKDPFVQQIDEDASSAPASTRSAATAAPVTRAATTPQRSTATPTPSLPTFGQSGSGSTGSTGTTTGTSTMPAPTFTAAIVRVNGVLQTIGLDKTTNRFPRTDKAFVLRALRTGSATIAVADGSFAGGGTLRLQVGRKVTLVNTATGVRYVIQLVHVASATDNVKAFSAK